MADPPRPEAFAAESRRRHAEERPAAASRSTHDAPACLETARAAPPQHDAARSSRPPPDEDSRAILGRVARESETLGTSALARAGRRVGGHFAGADAVGADEGGGTDRVELWGRRVGRGLSLLLGIGLTWWLGAQLGWW